MLNTSVELKKFKYYLYIKMFALLCKPVVVPVKTGNPVLRANDCRIAYVKPSQTQEGKLELEILEAPPVYIGPDKQNENF